jgi:DNA-directed RNA polymerase subunit RPC12/RpoP
MTETRRTYSHICLRCGASWENYREHPAACRDCRSTLWNKERVRFAGGGLYRKAVALDIAARKIVKAMKQFEARFPEAEREEAKKQLRQEIGRLRQERREE